MVNIKSSIIAWRRDSWLAKTDNYKMQDAHRVAGEKFKTQVETNMVGVRAYAKRHVIKEIKFPEREGIPM